MQRQIKVQTLFSQCLTVCFISRRGSQGTLYVLCVLYNSKRLVCLGRILLSTGYIPDGLLSSEDLFPHSECANHKHVKWMISDHPSLAADTYQNESDSRGEDIKVDDDDPGNHKTWGNGEPGWVCDPQLNSMATARFQLSARAAQWFGSSRFLALPLPSFLGCHAALPRLETGDCEFADCSRHPLLLGEIVGSMVIADWPEN